jgi:ribosome-associated protein
LEFLAVYWSVLDRRAQGRRGEDGGVDSDEKLDLIVEALEGRRAVDLTVLDVSHLTQMTDYMVICTGTSNIHIRALADAVLETMKEAGIKGTRAEGYNDARWVLIDYGDVVLHIFAETEREFYQLEKFWGGAPRVLEERQAAPAQA